MNSSTDITQISQDQKNQIKVLIDGQQIKMEEFEFRPKVTVYTVEKFLKDFFNDDEYEIQLQKVIEKAKTKSSHSMVWTTKSPAVLVSNYPGKAAEHERKRIAFENATLLSEGETVIIENRKYTVKLVGEKYSDPIHFIPV